MFSKKDKYTLKCGKKAMLYGVLFSGIYTLYYYFMIFFNSLGDHWQKQIVVTGIFALFFLLFGFAYGDKNFEQKEKEDRQKEIEDQIKKKLKGG